MKVYFDSSSFAKRFIDETGSDQVEKICSEASALGVSVLCVPEIVSALNRCRREKRITKANYDNAKKCLIEDVRDAEIINLTTSVIGSSILVLESNLVRTLDALHVACAIEWNADLFVSSDHRQLQAAKKAGLKIQKI